MFAAPLTKSTPTFSKLYSLNIQLIAVHYYTPDDGPNRLKQAVIDGCYRCIDIFCVWNCGFPWSFLQKYVAFVVFDPFAELLITVAIAVNTLFMAMDHYVKLLIKLLTDLS